MNEIHRRVDQLFAIPPYGQPPEERQDILLRLLKDELEDACDRNAKYRNYVENWPVHPRSANRISDLPYLPVGLFKTEPPLSLVEPAEIRRVLTSSSTTGQMPSRIALDSPTARRMTKGVVTIAQDFIGSNRRPYLIADVPESTKGGPQLGARGAAIQGLQPFASAITYCLDLDRDEGLLLNRGRLDDFAESHGSSSVLVYGFTYILWKHLVKPLAAQNINLNMSGAYILHSGGWKLLQDESVDKELFNDTVARVFGCSADRVIDFYGMVENVGVIYPDCPDGNKHVPAFAEVIVRNPLTLEPVAEGEQGIVQVCSVLPTSFPGNLLLTEDVAGIVSYDRCRCGRRGTCFRFAGRVAKAELRGCGNIERSRHRAA